MAQIQYVNNGFARKCHLWDNLTIYGVAWIFSQYMEWQCYIINRINLTTYGMALTFIGQCTLDTMVLPLYMEWQCYII